MRLTRWAVPGTAFGVLVAALAGCGGGANNIFNPSQPSQPSSTSQPSNGATPPAETVFVSDDVGAASSNVGPNVIDVFNSHISNGGKFTAQITNSNMTTAFNIATFGGSIYVSNAGQAGGPGAAIFVFPESANGPTTPTRKISGPASQLVAPQGVAVDNSGNIYVADSTGGPNGNGQVDVYAPGSNVPLRTLGGTLSQIDQPTGIAVDSQGDVFVANDAGGSVGGTGSLLEFAPGVGYNTAPIFVYGNGQLSAPVAVTLDDVGNILVSCDGNNQILEFAANTPSSIGSLLQANGIDQPQGLVADSSGFLYVVNLGSGSSGIGPNISVYASGASQPVLQFAGKAGSQSTFVAPSGIAL
jgi:hypothetical protein